ARVGGRPGGWGAAPNRSSEPGSLQLSLDFDTVSGKAKDGSGVPGADGAARRAADHEAFDDLRAALAATIDDPERLELFLGGGIDTLAEWIGAQSALGAALAANDPRPLKGEALSLALAGMDGRIVAAQGSEDVGRLRHLVEASRVPLVAH